MQGEGGRQGTGREDLLLSPCPHRQWRYLIFVEPATSSAIKGQDFWATSIIIENGGELRAGTGKDTDGSELEPYGKHLKTLTFHLYGADPRGPDPIGDAAKPEGPGVSCAPIKDPSNFADCGIPLYTDDTKQTPVWTSNGAKPLPLPGGVTDSFYQYGSLHGNSGTDKDTGQVGHFGYKVLGLSYGGTLRLRGFKGTSLTLPPDPDKPAGDPAKIGDIAVMLKAPEALSPTEEKVITNSGADWARLAQLNKTASRTDSGSQSGRLAGGRRNRRHHDRLPAQSLRSPHAGPQDHRRQSRHGDVGIHLCPLRQAV